MVTSAASNAVPKSVDELLIAYDGYITGCIKKISRNRLRPEDVQDLKHDIAVRALDKNYLDKYDAGKSAFTTFLFCLIRTVVINNFERQQRDPLTFSSPIASGEREEEGDSTARPSVRTLREATLRDMVDDSFERQQIAHDISDRIEATLGERTNLGPLRTFRLMRDGKPANEIAKALGVGPTCISAYFKRIKQDAAKFGAVVFIVLALPGLWFANTIDFDDVIPDCLVEFVERT